MESEKPFITKRPHTKSRNGCQECKRRKQKCDEVRPKCRHCKKRGVECKYGSQSMPHIFGAANTFTRAIREVKRTENILPLSKSSPSSSDSWSSESTDTTSPELSVVPTREIARNEFSAIRESLLQLANIPGSLQTVPWQNPFEHRMYNAFCKVHRESMSKPGMDNATKEIWLDLVPKIAFNSQGALFSLLLSIGSMHEAIKTGDYPNLQGGSRAANLWERSISYFSDATASFRNSIVSRRFFEANPEVFCVTALVLSFRTSLFANDLHTDVNSLYDDILGWFTSTLGYIDVGGFFTDKLQNTRLGYIMKANPGATYHFFPFITFIESQNYPYFNYLHPKTDPKGNVDPEDLTDESLHAYGMSIKLIGWVYKAVLEGQLKTDIYAMFHIVPYTVPKHFLVLLQKKRPRAIAVLAHHMALLAFLGVYEHLRFWSREHILLLMEIVPQNWIWALKKALRVVDSAERLHLNTALLTLSEPRLQLA